MILIEPIRNGKYIKDGAYYLATQIWALSHLKFDEIVAFPAVLDPYVQIGYFQNPEVEVNFKYLKEHNIPIVRRDTGGGAIYIDSNQMGVCYLIPYKNNESILGNYEKFLEPAIRIIKELGAKNVIQSGKNDLTIDGFKVSGAAMALIGDTIYSGNTYIYKIDYDAMSQVLRPNRKKIEAKGIKSIRQRIAQLSDYFDEPYKNMDIFEFKDLVVKKLFNVQDLSEIKRYVLTEHDWEQIDELVNAKYKNWDWNYGLSPRYEYNRDARLAIGTINFSLAIEGQKIKKIKISGDFFAKKNITELEKSLVGVKLDYDELLSAINKANLDEYFFNNISAEEVVKVILGEVDDE